MTAKYSSRRSIRKFVFYYLSSVCVRLSCCYPHTHTHTHSLSLSLSLETHHDWLFDLVESRYPVFFLTESGVECTPHDLRRNSINAAIDFASAGMSCTRCRNYAQQTDPPPTTSTVPTCTTENLMGLVCRATPIVRDPSIITTIKEAGLLVFTWGNEKYVQSACVCVCINSNGVLWVVNELPVTTERISTNRKPLESMPSSPTTSYANRTLTR
jgi:hypothetical protein